MGQGFWGGFPPGGTGYPCRCGKLNGGFPPAAPAIPAAVVPEGGLPFWLPVAPAFSLFVCPYPPNPLPRRGRGRPKLFHARGFAPCIPATEPGRHLQNQPSGCPAGCCILPRLLCLPYQCFPAPYPPDPLPRRGRGRPRLFHARGSAPCIPSIRPPAALAIPAAVENSMAAFPQRHRLSLPLWKTQWGLSPGGTGSPCPGGEDHLKRRRRLRRIVPSPPVPPLLGCRHCT